MKNTRKLNGFALPTVLISSVVLMALLALAAQSISGVSSALSDSVQSQQAREAAESGVARALACLGDSSYIAAWTNANKLYAHTACSGGSPCTNSATANCYVMSDDTTRTWFEVDAPTRLGSAQVIAVKGYAEQIRASDDAVLDRTEVSLNSRIGADVNFNTVTFGYNLNGSYFAAIGDNGRLYTVGYNADGQLGNGTNTSSAEPSDFILPDQKRATAAYASFLSIGFHMYAITEDGMGYATGRNNNGQLGIGRSTSSPILTPESIKIPGVPNQRKIKYAVPLHNSTFFVMSDDTMYASGHCGNGQLGIGPTSCTSISTPQQMVFPSNFVPVKVSADRIGGYVLGANGAVYGWGMNDQGQLANYSYTDAYTPIVIGSWNGTTRKAVDIGYDGVSFYIIDQDGTAWSAGEDVHGQLGLGTTTYNDVRTMTRMDLSACTGRAVKVSTDQWSASILTDTGEVCSAGLNSRGQLGNGNTWHQTRAVKFRLPAGVRAVDVYNTSTGDSNPDTNNVFVIGDNGRVYGAGGNMYGQLGDGTTTARSTPVAMQVFDGVNVRAERIQAGYGTTVILSTDKKIYTVGNNSHGQLGDGTTTNSSTPKANRLTNIVPVLNF